jgi:lipopolysaccharide/colanic/teichoic acid biosynthesis glycosyltransferase
MVVRLAVAFCTPLAVAVAVAVAAAAPQSARRLAHGDYHRFAGLWSSTYRWRSYAGSELAGFGSFVGRTLKRTFDFVVAAAVLLLLACLLVGIAIAIKLESPGPALYRAPRVGRGGRELRMLKFRKMRDKATGPRVTGPRDERLTRVGRFLANTKLDEVPQLWNVLTGSMSLVGPRPQDPMFVELRRADYDEILQVKPGITGLYQLAFARETELLDRQDHVADYVRRMLPVKTQLDRLYVAHRSTLMDLRVIAWTAVAVVLRKDVAVNRSTARLRLRRRPPRYVLESGPVEADLTIQ